MSIKTTLFIATSLDGMIARKDNSIDWLFTDGDYGYKAFYESIDAIVTGRITYEISLNLAPDPFQDKRVIVYSHQKSGNDSLGAEYTNELVSNLVKRLEAEGHKHVWLVGGKDLIRDFLNARLIDTIVISIHPITLGDGIPCFVPGVVETKWKLLETQAFASGLVQLRYELLN